MLIFERSCVRPRAQDWHAVDVLPENVRPASQNLHTDVLRELESWYRPAVHAVHPETRYGDPWPAHGEVSAVPEKPDLQVTPVTLNRMMVMFPISDAKM